MNSFDKIFTDLDEMGQSIKTRGLLVIEIENYSYTLAPYERYVSYPARKMKLNYIKKEFLWYLKGDKYDTSICDHAKMWKDLINEDGSINSNYGQYVFGSQFQYGKVIDTLRKDKNSRRASIMILSQAHLATETKDYPCTYSINFRIRNNRLNMTVRMRSQDAIFGMTNDAPCFSFIHEMVYVHLRDLKYPDLLLGDYHHSADSFHIYARHFQMFKNILENIRNREYNTIQTPRISSSAEVRYLRGLHIYREKYNGSDEDFIKSIKEEYKFTKWLLSED